MMWTLTPYKEEGGMEVRLEPAPREPDLTIVGDLTLTWNPMSWCYYPHSAAKKMEARRLSDLSKITDLPKELLRGLGLHPRELPAGLVKVLHLFNKGVCTGCRKHPGSQQIIGPLSLHAARK